MVDAGVSLALDDARRTSDAALVRRLSSVVAFAAMVLTAAAATVATLLSGDVDTDLAIVPAARGAEVVALVAGVVVALAVGASVLRGRRWLGRIRPAFPAIDRVGEPVANPVAAGLVAGSYSTMLRAVPASPGGAWYDVDVTASTRTAGAAIGLTVVGLSLVAIGLIGGRTASGLESARSAWVGTAIGAILLTIGSTLARWLVGDIERRARAIRRLTEASAPETGAPERRRLHVLGAMAGIALAIVGGTTASRMLAATESQPCLSIALECRTVTVPADQLHGGPRGDARTISYGVRRGTGERLGTMVIVPGGPGVAGVPTWEVDYERLDERLLAAYDVVAFDPRGTGGSGGADCPAAAERFSRSLSSDADPSVITTFTDACPVEARVEQDELRLYAGAQVVEDIDAIRADLGVEQIVLYGESYGTATATRYAMTHPDRLTALILDAPLDVTQDLEDFWLESAAGFESTLDRTFAWCQDDPGCGIELPEPEQAWEQLHDRLAGGPIEATYAGADGVVRAWPVSRTDVVSAFAAAMYTERGRMLAMRALAAAERDDLVPVARMVHPAEAATEDVVIDSTFAYTATLCGDRVERDAARDPAGFLDWASNVHTGADRMRDVVLSAAPCSAWPTAPSSPPPPTLPEDLEAPVVILTSTGDPVTPAAIGRRLAARWSASTDVYEIETTGGPHVTFARGDSCPDGPVVGLLIDGHRPPRLTRCQGQIASDYQPVVRRSSDTDGLVLRALALDDELYNHPQYAAWYGVGSVTVGCRHGGTMTVAFAGVTERIDVNGCAVLPGEPIDGTGAYYRDGSFRFDVSSTRGRWSYEGSAAGATLEGTFDGVAVQESW